MNKVHYNNCPACNSADINPLLTVKDHSVSREDFVIWQCGHCTLRFTQDVPDGDSMASYYRSEDYISHTNTSKGFINRLYQKVRKYTLQQKAGLVMHHTIKKGRILDIGAGTGAFLNAMKSKEWEVQGVEPDAGARNRALQLYGLHLNEPDILEQLPPQRFDAITMWHVLEHVHGLHETIEKLKSLLKPGGRIIIAVPNYQSKDNDIYKLFWAAYDVPRHLYHFTPRSMEMLMKKHGLHVIEKRPMWFDSFYISLLSSKYKNGTASWIGAGISGLRSNITAVFDRDKCSSVIYVISKDQRSN